VRVQGLQRYYALLLVRPGKAQLVKVLDEKSVLAEVDFAWEYDQSYDLRLKVTANRLQGWIDGRLLLDVADLGSPLSGGGIALVVEEGSLAADTVLVQ
jgi:hypothetical protein